MKGRGVGRGVVGRDGVEGGGEERKKKNSVSDGRWSGLLHVLVCLRLQALKLWASLAELLTANHSFILSPRGAFTVLVVKKINK